MGIDLTLFPVEYESGLPNPSAWSHVVLPLERDYYLFNAFRGADDRECPDQFRCYAFDEFKPVEVDCYGKRLRAVRAGDLLKAWPRTRRRGRNMAARGYLEGLDEKSWVVLFWH